MEEDLESSVESLPRQTEKPSRPDLGGKDYESIDREKVDGYRNELESEKLLRAPGNTKISSDNVEVDKAWFAKGDMSYLFSARILGLWFACKKSWISIEDNRARYVKEIENLRALQPSPHWHVIQFIGNYECERADMAEGYMILSPLAECTLEQYLSRSPTPRQKLVVRAWFGCLAAALKNIHENNMKHKDIKTENILVHGDNIIITDLGISNTFTGGSTSYGGSPGTQAYWAPEVHDQGRGVRRGRQQDVWSLMCCFIEILSFALGFNIPDFRKSCNPHTWTFSFNGDYEKIVTWLYELKKQTKDRELLALLDLLLNGFKKEAEKRPDAIELFDRLRRMDTLVGKCCALPRDHLRCGPKIPSLSLSMDPNKLQVGSISHFAVSAGRRFISRTKSSSASASMDELLWDIEEEKVRSIRSVERNLLLYIAPRKCCSAQEYLSFCNAFIGELVDAVLNEQYRPCLYDEEAGEEEKPYTTAYFAILVEVILSRCRTNMNRWIHNPQDQDSMRNHNSAPETVLPHHPGKMECPGSEKSSEKGKGLDRAEIAKKEKAPEKAKTIEKGKAPEKGRSTGSAKPLAKGDSKLIRR